MSQVESLFLGKVSLEEAHPFGFLLLMAAFALQWQSRGVVTETTRLAKPEIFLPGPLQQTFADLSFVA